MAVTYKKALKTISVTIHGSDTPIEVSDTATEALASYALAEFERGDVMHLVGENSTVLVPYHAVIAVEVSVAESEELTRDAYGCDE